MLRATLRSLFAHKLRLVLSGVAVILGVAFVVGSLVLTDTLGNVFDHIFASADEKISVVVRGVKAPVGNGRELVPISVLPRVRSVPGVAAAVGLTDGYAQLVDRHGDAYPSTAGPPALGISYDDNPLLSSVEFRSGRGPRAADEIAIDAATAAATGYQVGDRAPVLSLLPRTDYTIVGIFTVAGNANEGGASIVLFDPAQARAVMAERTSFNEIDVAATAGESDIELRDRIAAVLPAGTAAVTGATEASDSANQVKHGLSFFNTFLLVFAGVALFVGAFIIFNTFSMLVAQRQREVAVLRALGASRGQVLGAVLVEAGVVGTLAATIGIGLGLLIAVGLRALVGHLGGGALPDGALVLAPRTFVAAYLVGVLVTAVAALIPARRSARTPPVAALRGLQTGEISGGRSALLGVGLVVAGVATLALGLRASLALVGIGAGLSFLGIVVLSPIAVPTIVGLLGAPLARRVPGALGRRNAMRNPRRTSATAGALMVGLALVSAVSILAASVKTSTRAVIDETFAADLDVQSSSGAGLTPSLARSLARASDIAEVDSLFFTNARVAGQAAAVTALPGRAIGRTVDVQLVAGRLALAPGEILVAQGDASSAHLRVGERVTVRYPTGPPHRLLITGVYKDNSLAGSYLVDASERRYLPGALDDVVLVKARAGVSLAEVEATARRIAAPYPNAKVQDRSQFIGSELGQLDALLNFVTALLGLSVVIAVLGIVNTLALSVIERTRELGLLRAVGLSRRQLRRMIRSESVVVAVYGAVLGTAVGICFGIAITEALRREGVTNLTLPFVRMAVFVVLAGLAGVVAAIWPARRAAGIDVLSAIATE